MKDGFLKWKNEYTLLKQTQEYQLDILRYMPVGFLSVDRDDQIILFNNAALRLINGRMKRVIKGNIFEFFKYAFSENNQGIVREMYRRVKSDQQRMDIVLYDKGAGNAGPGALYRATGIGFLHNVLIFIASGAGEYRDPQQLILQENAAIPGQSIPGITHDLGNHVASIVSSLSGIKEEVDALTRGIDLLMNSLPSSSYPESAVRRQKKEIKIRKLRMHDYFSYMFPQMNAMSEKIRALLRYGRPQPIIRRSVCLNALAEEVIRIMKKGLSSSIRFVLDLAPGLPLIPADPDRIKDMLVNLVQNGIQAMDGKGCLFCSTDYLKSRKIIRIKIRDTGHGISESIRKSIFTPFFTTRINGTGLGLANAQNTVRQHNGNIFFKSRTGKGTTFIVELPV